MIEQALRPNGRSNTEPDSKMLACGEPPFTSDAYLPLKMLAAYSGLSVRTLRVYLADPLGSLPHYRIGGKILVRRFEFDGWARRFRRAGSGNLDSMVDELLKGIA